MKPIIQIENLSKQYRLGTIGTGTLSNDLKRWYYKVRGKEDPFLKVGDTNDRAVKGDSEYVWALKNINVEIAPGEVIGIIGKNGAGKSTLLKILSKVTGPTTGSIKYDGRIGSLLEVGTGFHPELTGRENIYLNGAILGMTKQEIRSKLDEIIDFSGCERYIDTPVKRYSSGMTVRLGFAVAAHLEPEVLVVDEVLAVGDAEFQKKAIGKMQDVSTNDGRTVLFVSHNMASIRTLCKRGIVIEQGTVAYDDNVEDCISYYLNGTNNGEEGNNAFMNFKNHEMSYIDVQDFQINETKLNPVLLNSGNNKLNIEIRGHLKTKQRIAVELRLYDNMGIPMLFHSPGHYEGKVEEFPAGDFIFKREIDLPREINKGVYTGSLFLTDPGAECHVAFESALTLNIEGFTTKTGHVFEYKNGAGFLFIP